MTTSQKTSSHSLKLIFVVNYRTSFFITSIYQLKKQFRIIFINRKIAKFIYDQYFIFGKMAKSIFQSVLVICFLQLLNKIMTFDEICTISTLCRGNALYLQPGVFYLHHYYPEIRCFHNSR